MKNKPVLRCCALTKERLPKKELLRIVRDKDGNVFIDDTHKANGRGCYLKKDKEVIIKAQKSKILDRNLNVNVSDEIYDELLKKL
jgi:predicted RNA-binding protein YlxR (DUF448 family)